ncbi:MAG: ABC transporter ATP-binding protein [Chloroflexi bacterium]|nr:ABC transporter ATP-binding protein [Chloroflexota bacterium]
MSNHSVIVARDLRKRYGDLQAVDGMSFEVRRGEIFGMLGPNGAGKTTTIEILEGMRRADSGEALIDGIDVTRRPKRVKAIIGVQLQAAAFFDHLKLVEIVSLFADCYGVRVDARSTLERVGLAEKATSYYPTLSGGQKQRLSIAVALVNQPVVLFLDEPTTGLDPQARRHMWELITGIRADGTTVVLTTHYMEEAEELCDRVAIVDRGRLVALDSPPALVDRLIATGFRHDREVKPANLEDVFINLTGHRLREE